MFKHTRATKAKLSKMRSGKKNPFYGKKHSAKAKAKMAAWTRKFNASRQYEIKDVDINLVFSPEQIGYLAGIIDGEGSITLTKGTKPVVRVYNCETSVMKWLVKVVGGNFCVAHRNGREPNHCWSIGGANNVFWFLKTIRHALIIKTKQADWVSEFLEKKYGVKLWRK